MLRLHSKQNLTIRNMGRISCQRKKLHFYLKSFFTRKRLIRETSTNEIRLVISNHVSRRICNDYTTITIGRTQPSNKSFLVESIRAILLTILYFLRLYFPDFYVAQRCYLFHFYAFHHYNVRIFCFGLVNSSL